MSVLSCGAQCVRSLESDGDGARDVRLTGVSRPLATATVHFGAAAPILETVDVKVKSSRVSLGPSIGSDVALVSRMEKVFRHFAVDMRDCVNWRSDVVRTKMRITPRPIVV